MSSLVIKRLGKILKSNLKLKKRGLIIINKRMISNKHKGIFSSTQRMFSSRFYNFNKFNDKISFFNTKNNINVNFISKRNYEVAPGIVHEGKKYEVGHFTSYLEMLDDSSADEILRQNKDPMELTFQDFFNVTHKIKVSSTDSQGILWFPIHNGETIFHHATGGSEKINFAKLCNWGSFTFSFYKTSFPLTNNNGIRIQFQGYRFKDEEHENLNLKAFHEVLQDSKDVVDVIGALNSAISQPSKPEGEGGKPGGETPPPEVPPPV